MTKVNQKKSKPSSRSTVTPHFTVSYTNIRGLQKNLPEVEAFIEETKPDFLSLCETGSGISGDIFHLPGYLPVITKEDHLNRHGHGLAVFIKDGFPCGRVSSYEDPELPCIRDFHEKIRLTIIY